jgi:site-specific DNA-methyltransferase (cytosine-N4-specific)
MTKRSRQTTLNAPNGEADGLENVDWTFSNADTQYLTHGLHPYPARMIPQIPATLLNHYKRTGVIDEGDRVYDPFSGSGTTAVEARLHGLHAEANDVNPLACLLTLAKSTPLDAERLAKARDSLIDGLDEELAELAETYGAGEDLDVTVPEIRDGWFPEPQLQQLSHIRERIDALEDEYGQAVARVFRVVLSKTARAVSYQRNGEYKRYRIPEAERGTHDPEVLALFETELDDAMSRVREYSQQADPALDTVVHYADSRTAADVADDSADIVITSPPYGDHDTTVAYGQFSQDPAIVAGEYSYDEMKSVDKTGLGGSNRKLEPLDELESFSPALAETLDILREKDGRATDAMEFFRDYFEVMKQVARVLKPGQPVAWVVANRTMSRVNVPTHLITRELCEQVGYDHDVTLPREIPTKTLPWSNAPENVPGQTGELMAKENIVVLRSPD